jgi:probable HAF family extracellular repeat protein
MKRTILTLSILGLICSSAFALPQYSITPLVTHGSPDSYATGINDSGKIVGYTVDENGLSSPKVWDLAGNATPLPALANSDGHAEPTRVNASGFISGLSRTPTGDTHAVMWKPDGTIVDIPTLGGVTAFAQDISNSGVVVGSSYVANGGSHAFTWTEAGGLVDYGSFNSTDRNYHAGFNAVNDAGKKGGTGYRLFSPYKASISLPGETGVTDISPPAQYSQGMVLGMNEGGTTVGYQNINGRGSPHPVIFNEDLSLTDLGTLELGEGWAIDVNDAGVIVGRVFGFDDVTGEQIMKAFVYTEGRMYDLMDLVNQAEGTRDWTLFFEATSINNSGQIVGEGLYKGEVRPFVLSVVPEPSTLTAIALCGVMVRRQRR